MIAFGPRLENTFAGHDWDLKCVDWHPSKPLLVSGGKDNLVKLWDTKSGRELCSFHGHKNTVLFVSWNQNGNWVLTASKDQIIKHYLGIHFMKNTLLVGVTSIGWLGMNRPTLRYRMRMITVFWDLAWHPIGYILCSGGNDHTTKLWCRNRPGDTSRNKFIPGKNQGISDKSPAYGGWVPGPFPIPELPTTPGPFGMVLPRNEGTIPGIGVAMPLSVPSLDSSDQGDQHVLFAISGTKSGPATTHFSFTFCTTSSFTSPSPQMQMPANVPFSLPGLPNPSMPSSVLYNEGLKSQSTVKTSSGLYIK